MIQKAFSSIIRSIKLHIQRQVLIRPLLLPADKCLTLCVLFCSPDDGRKNRLKYVERLTEINKFEKHYILLVYSEKTLVMHRPMNVKLKNITSYFLQFSTTYCYPLALSQVYLSHFPSFFVKTL